MILRPYQNRAVACIEREWRDHQSTLLCCPTASGKTVIFSEIIRRAFPRRAIVLCHRKELIDQAVAKIRAATGWRVDVEMGEHRADMSCMFGGPRVVVSTIQTQASGGDGGGRMTRFDPMLFGVLVADESHHSVSPQWRKVIDWYTKGNPGIKILGVTASPDRLDQEALGQVFETVAMDYEIHDAINDGWIVPVEQQVVHVEGLDFSHCRTTAGDLNGADLARVMEAEETLHRVVSPTIEIIGNRRALVFSASVDHAERMCELFNRHRPGMAAWVCGKTPTEERDKTNAAFRSGAVQVVVNCAIYTEGADFPGVSVIVMARPTKSRALYSQMAGRGFRPAESIAHELNDHESAEARKALIEASEKPSCLLLDFVGVSGRHKLMTSVDILGGNVTERVRELAIRRLGEKPGRVDEAIAEAQEEEEAEKARAAAKRARLTAKATYKMQSVNPFDVFQIVPAPERGWDRNKQLTEKQQSLLAKQGISTEGMPYSQAKQLLNALFDRWDKNLCSFKQAALLRKRGMNTNVTRDEASKTIDEISRREGWKKRETT